MYQSVHRFKCLILLYVSESVYRSRLVRREKKYKFVLVRIPVLESKSCLAGPTLHEFCHAMQQICYDMIAEDRFV